MQMGDIGAALQESERLWFDARSDGERRRALIAWLQGAIHAVEDGQYSQQWRGSPGEALIVALESVEFGETPSLLVNYGAREEVEPYDRLARARAKAVAAVDMLLEYNRGTPSRRASWAITVVSTANGMSHGSLKSLRAHVHASAGEYGRVRRHLSQAREDLERYLKTTRRMARVTGGSVDELMLAYFVRDQALFWRPDRETARRAVDTTPARATSAGRSRKSGVRRTL